MFMKLQQQPKLATSDRNNMKCNDRVCLFAGEKTTGGGKKISLFCDNRYRLVEREREREKKYARDHIPFQGSHKIARELELFLIK